MSGGFDFNFSETIPSQYANPSGDSNTSMPPMLGGMGAIPFQGFEGLNGLNGLSGSSGSSGLQTPQSSQVVDDSFEPMDIQAESRFENFEVNFVFNKEGYTLVNILKEYLDKFPEVQFVGKRKHHKLDDHIHLRIKLDRDWVEQNHTTTEQAMIDCLRRAGRKAINDCIDLRNTIPDVEIRTVSFEESDNQSSQTSGLGPSPFKTLFDPSEFTF